ncbi:MAG TPA: alginate lyase family protein [Vicinamibacterales bacterium]|nr:alginate lyase family protein [Vicinamibacterales bacterium]
MLKKLAHVSPGELRFRVAERSAVFAERLLVASGRERWDATRLATRLTGSTSELRAARAALASGDRPAAESLLRHHFRSRAPRFPLDFRKAEMLTSAIRRRFPRAAPEAEARGRRLLSSRHDLLGYEELVWPEQDGMLDWHADPVHGRRAPLVFWASVGFLDPSVGDHKIIWELNRHQHWLALGRAAWLNDPSPYRLRFAHELHGWVQANPPLRGINWASMLELALRSLSWIWALHFFNHLEDDPGGEGATWRVELLLGLDRQLRHIERHLSTYFSPNTHLLGEGLALYVAGRVLPELRSAARWAAAGRRILLQEARAQVNPDGGHAERSAHYHRYALDFYLLALSIGRLTADTAAGTFAEVATRLAVFCRGIAGPDGRLPMLGDDDGGLLFPICGRDPIDAGDSLGLAAALLDRPDLATVAAPEEVYWMLGSEPPVATPSSGSRLPEAIFPATGYVVLRPPGAHAILDVGVHGFLNGGHAHADALSLVLSTEGRPLLVDPGTGTYTMDSRLRNRFRSSAMHNTLELDGRPQSVPDGPFHWQSRADARLDGWRTADGFDYVEGSHDGYAPAVHRRALVRTDALWLVVDHVLDSSRHDVRLYWHLDPAWTLERESRSELVVRHPDGLLAGLASTARQREVLDGDADGLGWCAPRYGRLVPSLTLRYGDRGESPMSLITAIAAGAAALPLSIEAVPFSSEREDGWHRAAARIQVRHTTAVLLHAATTVWPAPPRSLQRIAAGDDGGELVTDARLALLALGPAGEPLALHLLDASLVMWTGPQRFDLPAAGDLHLDQAGLNRLSRVRG